MRRLLLIATLVLSASSAQAARLVLVSPDSCPDYSALYERQRNFEIAAEAVRRLKNIEHTTRSIPPAYLRELDAAQQKAFAAYREVAEDTERLRDGGPGCSTDTVKQAVEGWFEKQKWTF